jgi:Spy/CpxP family protein refolding chaperone
MRVTSVFVLSTLFALAGLDARADQAAPYSGEEQRTLKALSPAQVDSYLQGHGMGYAKAAELNRYPGPRHVLDLADELALSPEQQMETEALFDAMQARASSLGAQLVDREKELDRLFATTSMDAGRLRALTDELASLEGQLRFVHLKAHLDQRALLREEQIQRYDELRGYQHRHQPGQHGSSLPSHGARRKP